MRLLNRRKMPAKGQIVVELLLILPVFMLMIFFIMELGSIAYQTILFHHATYELARIGSLVAVPVKVDKNPKADPVYVKTELTRLLKSMYPDKANSIDMEVTCEQTFPDPQVSETGGIHVSEDLVLQVSYPARLVFPVAGFIMKKMWRGPNPCKAPPCINISMRMPIEKPFFQ